ncbi:hypothetical protein ASF22_02500 [Methylobacterium sp. Leaf87]|uniref:hypothetical protein n=1 Tax=Methylobacterium sp. Leaf87 TaxID=1736243 RepID=UPI0006F4322C|nr:hypothetical protein [Methylobacterium sp. Leaf87]KQO69498.1 hypothetical protein ASF22_02500 [Methylobacterium sp. Leaf87]
MADSPANIEVAVHMSMTAPVGRPYVQLFFRAPNGEEAECQIDLLTEITGAEFAAIRDAGDATAESELWRRLQKTITTWAGDFDVVIT